jgi:hypothetical protein
VKSPPTNLYFGPGSAISFPRSRSICTCLYLILFWRPSTVPFFVSHSFCRLWRDCSHSCKDIHCHQVTSRGTMVSMTIPPTSSLCPFHGHNARNFPFVHSEFDKVMNLSSLYQEKLERGIRIHLRWFRMLPFSFVPFLPLTISYCCEYQ